MKLGLATKSSLSKDMKRRKKAINKETKERRKQVRKGLRQMFRGEL